MTGRIHDVLMAPDTHANRPVATAVANGTLYPCSDHDLIYQSDGSAWSTWATLGGTTPALDDLTDVDLTGAATGDVLTKDAGGDWVAEAPGAGGGSTVNDPRWTPLSGQTTVDEFRDAALDADWVRVDNGANSSRVTWTEDGDALSFQHTTTADTAGEEHALMIPLSGIGGAMATGDAFIAAMQLHRYPADLSCFGGMILADGVTYGSGLAVGTLHNATNDTGRDSDDIRTLDGYNSGGTGTDAIHMPVSSLYWVRLVKTGASTWRRDFSPNGINWRTGAASVTKSFTPTHVGFWCSNWGGASVYPWFGTIECLRRVSGVS